MIYVSSACSKKRNIRESIQELVNVGFKNIELSGGTEYSETLEYDLKELQEKYNLKFLLHNYFPPPREHFVLNLASNKKEIHQKSVEHVLKAMEMSESLGASKFAFHAGFFIDPNVNELGKKIGKQQMFSSKMGIHNFIEKINTIIHKSHFVELYIENNVLSSANFNNFAGNPFMLTNSKAYDELKSQISFNLLLDVAHLKVSCKSLGLSYKDELSYLCSKTDYLHLSDNNGLEDSNMEILKNSDMFELLNNCKLKNKTISLEVYSGLDKVVNTFELIKPLVD